MKSLLFCVVLSLFAVLQSQQVVIPPPDARCMQPRTYGACLAYIERYYYDAKSKTCKQFMYGGCQGNANNFETKEECEEACAPLTPLINGGRNPWDYNYKPQGSGNGYGDTILDGGSWPGPRPGPRPTGRPNRRPRPTSPAPIEFGYEFPVGYGDYSLDGGSWPGPQPRPRPSGRPNRRRTTTTPAPIFTDYEVPVAPDQEAITEMLTSIFCRMLPQTCPLDPSPEPRWVSH